MKFFFSFIFLYSFFSIEAQTLRFQQTIGDKDAEAYSVLKTTGGGYVLSGKSWSHFNTDYDMFLAKLDSLGNILWKKTYGDLLVYEWETDIKKTKDGGYILTGQSFDLNTFLSNTFIFKTDSLGNISWHKSFDGTFKYVIPTNNGYLFAGVISDIGMGNNDFYLVKTDLNGNVKWSKSYGGVMNDVLNSALPYKNGWLLSGGSNSNTSGIANNYFIQTDSNGNSIAEYEIGDTTEASAICVVKKNTGGFYVAGTLRLFDTLGLKHRVISLYQVNDSFQIVWQKTLTCGYHSDVQKIIITKPDDGIAICGTKYDTDSSTGDAFLIKTDSLGQVYWCKTYGGAEEDKFNDLIQMSDTGFAIAGTSKSFSSSSLNNIYLVKTDLNGNSYCNFSPKTVLTSPSYFSTYSRHLTTDTGTIVATNNFTADTLSGHTVLCTSYITSVISAEKEDVFHLFPNPTENTVKITSEEEGVFYLQDIKGHQVFNSKIIIGTQELSLRHLETGIYFWYTVDLKGNIFSKGKLMLVK